MIESKFSDKETIIKNLRRIKGIGAKRGEGICYRIGIEPKEKWGEIKGRRRERSIRIIKEIGKRGGEKIDKEWEEEREGRRKRERARGTIKGRRQRKGYPSRGQRTKTNGKTAKKGH